MNETLEVLFMLQTRKKHASSIDERITSPTLVRVAGDAQFSEVSCDFVR